MKKKVNKEKFWMFVLGVTALVFFVAGILKVIDGDLLMATTSLITTLVFAMTAMKIAKGKVKFNPANDGLSIFFPIGFILSVVGGSGFTNAGVWGFGITLFLIGMLFSPKREEEFKEKEDAG